MTIKFKENQITAKEKSTRNPYIGYFAPDGTLIDYNIVLGGEHHDDWRNPVSMAFLSWISYIIKGTSIEHLKKWTKFPDLIADNQYPGIDEYVKRGYEYFYDLNINNMDDFLEALHGRIKYLEDLWKSLAKHEKGFKPDDYTFFEYQLLLFFRNAYKDGKFFDTIQRKIVVENPNVVKERLKQEYEHSDFFSESELDTIYREHLREELLSHFKDICVQYLGYDSLERFNPNGTEIKIPHWYKDYDFDFLANPRVITSSYSNINERFYNYLLMDWSVQQIPRYSYNEQTGIYEKSDLNAFYQSETEQELEQEIESIKKLVPLRERKKYFR